MISFLYNSYNNWSTCNIWCLMTVVLCPNQLRNSTICHNYVHKQIIPHFQTPFRYILILPSFLLKSALRQGSNHLLIWNIQSGIRYDGVQKMLSVFFSLLEKAMRASQSKLQKRVGKTHCRCIVRKFSLKLKNIHLTIGCRKSHPLGPFYSYPRIGLRWLYYILHVCACDTKCQNCVVATFPWSQ